MEVAGEGREGRGSRQWERKPRAVVVRLKGRNTRILVWRQAAVHLTSGGLLPLEADLGWRTCSLGGTGVCNSCHFPLPSPHPRGLVLPWLPPNLEGSHLMLWLSGARRAHESLCPSHAQEAV